jgi:hypothetical protein
VVVSGFVVGILNIFGLITYKTVNSICVVAPGIFGAIIAVLADDDHPFNKDPLYSPHNAIK